MPSLVASRRRRPIAFALAILPFAAALLVPPLAAQVATGAPWMSTEAPAPGGTLDLGNLNLHVDVPVVNRSGRGTPFDYALSYDSSVWYPVTSGSAMSWQPVAGWGWRGETEAATGYVSYDVVYQVAEKVAGM